MQKEGKYEFSVALKKAAHYCAYQERCHFELSRKLKEWEIYGLEAERIIAEMIQKKTG